MHRACLVAWTGFLHDCAKEKNPLRVADGPRARFGMLFGHLGRPFLHRVGKRGTIVWLPASPTWTHENTNQMFGCTNHSSISLPYLK
jgi:hypothetical protein